MKVVGNLHERNDQRSGDGVDDKKEARVHCLETSTPAASLISDSIKHYSPSVLQTPLRSITCDSNETYPVIYDLLSNTTPGGSTSRLLVRVIIPEPFQLLIAMGICEGFLSADRWFGGEVG